MKEIIHPLINEINCMLRLVRWFFSQEGYSGIQVSGMIEWGKKQNPKKALDQNLTPQKSHAEFTSLKNFQKGLNDVTRKKKIEIECLCLFIHHTI